MPPAYVPERGDLVWVTFDPQAGREQRGRRPALVVSPRAYNAKVGLAILCPVTSARKGYPFEVPLPTGLGIEGVILSDHVKNIDWRARRATSAGAVPSGTLNEVLARLGALLAIDVPARPRAR